MKLDGPRITDQEAAAEPFHEREEEPVYGERAIDQRIRSPRFS
jgi:hypothetical protein